MADNNEKTKTQKKPNAFVRAAGRTARWFREMRSELKKVVWPSWSQVVNNSWVVIICVFIVGALIALFDYVMSTGVRLLLDLTH